MTSLKSSTRWKNENLSNSDFHKIIDTLIDDFQIRDVVHL